MRRHIEVIFWLAAMVLLFFMSTEPGTSLCMFRFIGFSHCPGCGLGHAIHYALHLQFVKSFHEHFFGIPAMLIILNRIKQLSFPKKFSFYAK